MELLIDLDRCQGHGRCAECAPNVFAYDEAQSRGVVIEGVDPAEFRDEVDDAVTGCPESAISVVE